MGSAGGAMVSTQPADGFKAPPVPQAALDVSSLVRYRAPNFTEEKPALLHSSPQRPCWTGVSQHPNPEEMHVQDLALAREANTWWSTFDPSFSLSNCGRTTSRPDGVSAAFVKAGVNCELGELQLATRALA